jgi:biotin operon repressor
VARITARWVLREGIGALGLTKTEALVLLALLDHIGKDGVAWRSQTNLARDLRISRQWINEAQGRLRDRGLLIEDEPGRQGRATRYRFGDTRLAQPVVSDDRFTPSNLSSLRGKSNVIDMSTYLAGG